MEEDVPIGADPQDPPRSKSRWPGCVLLLTLCGAVLGLIITPNFMRAKSRGKLTACKSNCMNLGTGLEMWAADHGGHYPPTLAALTEGPKPILRQLPSCPAAFEVTYAYQMHADPDRFTLYCAGNNHSQQYTSYDGPHDNFPQYSSEHGLLEHP